MTPDLALIGRGLSPFIKPSSRYIGRHLIGEEILARQKWRETALEPILQKAAEEVSETIQPWGKAEIDQICLFLTSPEAEAIVRQIYAASSLGDRQKNIDSIRQEFLLSFALYTNIPEIELEDSASQIFDILLEGCEKALRMAIDAGKLSAHEARSEFRHRMILDELATIQKNLEFLTANRQLDIKAILKFEKQYREQVALCHSKITPPYLSDLKKLAIDRLYVTPNFISLQNRREENPEKLELEQFRGRIYRSVLLGNPGAGKSTFSQKLCYDLASHYSEGLLSERQVTPILVILREYGAAKKERNCSILQFIEENTNARYQVKPLDGAFEYLLLNGRVMVIFDGLDELTETSYRQEISENVELFCNLYPSVPVLATSREIGYKEAPLDEERFEIFLLSEFTEQQVKEYVQKWFAVDPDLSIQAREKNVEKFIEESKTVSDLRSNALMLGLMCNLYRGEGYIPKNRTDVYGKCAEMLFERWDKRRGITIPSAIKNIESQIKPTMMYLANWIYSDASLQSGVTEQKLVAKSTEYLHNKLFDDRDEAEQAAREFICFCRGRAWVFTDTGTTKEGELLYQFTHRTFLEYFTAAYLNRSCETWKELLEILLPRIANQEWYVVSQLAFQIQDRQREEAIDNLLVSLIEKADNFTIRNKEKWNLLLFAVQCLEFLIPKQKVVRRITRSVLLSFIDFGISNTYKTLNSTNLNILNAGEIEQSLTNSAFENKKTIDSVVLDIVDEKLDQKKYRELPYIIEISNRDIVKHISQAQPDELRQICKTEFLVCLLSFEKDIVSLSNFIEWHGIEKIFQNYRYRIFLGRSRLSAVYDLLYDFIAGHAQKSITKAIKDFEVISNLVLSSSMPWLFLNFDYNFDYNYYLYDCDVFYHNKFINKLEAKLDKYSVFGFYALFATLWEIDESTILRDLVTSYEHSNSDLLNFIIYIFMCRRDNLEVEIDDVDINCIDNTLFNPLKSSSETVNELLTQFNFTPEQKDFIWRWIRGEINFVAKIEEEEEAIAPPSA